MNSNFPSHMEGMQAVLYSEVMHSLFSTVMH